MNEEQSQTFVDETTELLADLESALVDLEEQPENGELIGRIFRSLHTIKGSAGMFGLEGLASFVHELESVFDLVRAGELEVTTKLVSCSLRALDQLKLYLASGDAVNPELDAKGKTILHELQQLTGRQPAAAKLPPASLTVQAAATAAQQPPSEYSTISPYLGLLTQFEMSRIMGCLRKQQDFYHVKKVLRLENLEENLTRICKEINTAGEVISTIPSSDGVPQGSFGFEFLFVTRRNPSELSALLGVSPAKVDMTKLLNAGKDGGTLGGDLRTRQEKVVRIRFSPRPESLQEGLDPIAVLKELRRLGDCYTVAHNRGMPDLERLDPKLNYTYWDIILSTLCELDQVRDVFIFLKDAGEISIRIIDDGVHDDMDTHKRLGEILLERGDISDDELQTTLARQIPQTPLGTLLVESDLVTADLVESSLIEQNYVKALRAVRQQSELASTLRVPAEKLDLLVNLVGEMVTVQARLSQCSTQLTETSLPALEIEIPAIAEELERLVAELRDTTLNIRMLPIGSTFSKFKRLVRDLSGELGKSVQLTTSGSETELDKTVIEKLNDPLVHLIRNCIDHGIETAEERRSAGKPVQGTIHLAASHAGDSVQIVIEDDGAGLDLEVIRRKAMENGLISPGSDPPEKELIALIFAPGFTTASKVSDVSGRGVGMDVVKRSIESLRGSIDIETKPGNGTRIAIKLPLTLAIIESLLVSVGEERFVLPLTKVEECVELSSAERQGGHGDLVEVRSHLVPYVDLRDRFDIGGEPPEFQQVVIMDLAGERVGVVVDQVIGEHQAVIKSLGKYYRHVDQISGATILGDGSVALIVDVARLAQDVRRTAC